MARAVRRWGSRKYLLASLDQSLRAHGPRLRRHLLLAPLRPGHAARGDDGRAGHAPCARARRSTSGISSYSPERTREAARILRELGTPLLIHQPSYSMLNRWIEDGLLDVLERRGRRLHRLLAAGPGAAHRQVPRRRPGGLARHAAAARSPRSSRPTRTSRTVRALNEIAERPRADAGAAGARLGAARPARHLGADRREQRRAARAQRRRARQSRLHRRGARGDRPLRHGVRHQPLGALERGLGAVGLR